MFQKDGKITKFISILKILLDKDNMVMYLKYIKNKQKIHLQLNFLEINLNTWIQTINYHYKGS